MTGTDLRGKEMRTALTSVAEQDPACADASSHASTYTSPISGPPVGHDFGNVAGVDHSGPPDTAKTTTSALAVSDDAHRQARSTLTEENALAFCNLCMAAHHGECAEL